MTARQRLSARERLLAYTDGLDADRFGHDLLAFHRAKTRRRLAAVLREAADAAAYAAADMAEEAYDKGRGLATFYYNPGRRAVRAAVLASGKRPAKGGKR